MADTREMGKPLTKAKTRKTYMVEDNVDHKIEVIAAVEGKSKSDVVDEAFQKHISTKHFLKRLVISQKRGSR